MPPSAQIVSPVTTAQRPWSEKRSTPRRIGALALPDGPGSTGRPWLYRTATDTTGSTGGLSPSEPRKGRLEKLKMPPSSATIM